MNAYTCLHRQRFVAGSCALVPVAPEHIENIRLWRNAQLSVLRQMAPLSRTEQENYYATAIWPQMSDPAPANLLLAFLENDKHIGYGGLVHIAWPHRRAEVSFLLAPERAADPERCANDFSTFFGLLKAIAFDDLNLNRIFTETYAQRTQHIAILEKNGLRREGILRQHVIVDGKATDSILHGLLRSDHEK
jgi:RimJ/RimL family protein N-acetyltransferase